VSNRRSPTHLALYANIPAEPDGVGHARKQIGDFGRIRFWRSRILAKKRGEAGSSREAQGLTAAAAKGMVTSCRKRALVNSFDRMGSNRLRRSHRIARAS
jgi:hypothetical protein